MKLNRFTRAAVIALLIAATANTASAAQTEEDAQSSASQTQYVRLHSAAVAFTEAWVKIADRYGPIEGAKLDLARDLILQSEQAAQRRNFDQASQQAKTAYELLRAAITEVVSKPQAANRTNSN